MMEIRERKRDNKRKLKKKINWKSKKELGAIWIFYI